jgi:UDP-N-acetylglucosamine diphosphorylase/glucosamine-1-phosphate N-acetyltransferase
MELAVIILAAGKGTRMQSDLAKVLHPLCGKPLIAWAIEAVQPLAPARIVVVVGHQAESVQAAVAARFDGIKFATQHEMKGTGHAVQQAAPLLRDFDGHILVTCGDVPLLSTSTLRALLRRCEENAAAAALLVARLDEPGSYGRVLCAPDGSVTQIVEAKDASPDQLAVQTVNAGTYCFDSRALWRHINSLTNQNQSGEYYLTDIIGLLTGEGARVEALIVDEREMRGVNTREQLRAMEEELTDTQLATKDN